MHTRRRPILGALGLVLVGAGWFGFLYRGPAADMTHSAEALLAALDDQQRVQATMAFDDPQRLKWHFIPMPHRKGLQIKHMNADQRKLAHDLLKAGLSQIGYNKATTIMSLEAILHELEKSRKDGPIRDTERYYFTIFGQPRMPGQWGWSVEGHHLSLNFVVRDGRVAGHTPAFLGANPATVRTEIAGAPKIGTRVLKAEEELAFELINSLPAEQQKAALIAPKAPSEIRAAGDPQPPQSSPEGLAASQFTDAQKQTLWSLIEAYAANMPPDLGAARLAEIKEAGLEKVHFAWAGARQPGIGHYYRLQGPTFLVEFVNTQPDASGNPANHIHSVWRNMKGDFGVGL